MSSRFTAEQVLALGDDTMEDYELLDGELIRRGAKGPLQELVASRLARCFVRALPPGFHARKGACVSGDPMSLPEPDVAIVRGRLEDYRERLPGGRDVILAVEVSVSTPKKDKRKLPILARAGVPTVWILDVVGRRLLVHTGNLGDRYASVLELTESEAVDVPLLGVRWTVASMID